MTADASAADGGSSQPSLLVDSPSMVDLIGLWECGECGDLTDVSHYCADRQTGVMHHEADPVKRAERAARCGWSYGYGYVGNDKPIRCALAQGHLDLHNPKLHGYGRFTEDWDAVRPYETQNGADRG